MKIFRNFQNFHRTLSGRSPDDSRGRTAMTKPTCVSRRLGKSRLNTTAGNSIRTSRFVSGKSQYQISDRASSTPTRSFMMSSLRPGTWRVATTKWVKVTSNRMAFQLTLRYSASKWKWRICQRWISRLQSIGDVTSCSLAVLRPTAMYLPSHTASGPQNSV